MISFWRIFWLEFVSFVRSRTLGMLIAASVLWMLVLPSVMRGDGTAEGARELYVHYSLGGVFALLVIALLASATGSLARERAARRLQLTLVRPVRYVTVVLGKVSAHVVAGALVLALACGVLMSEVDFARPCDHVLSPILPSPREEALAMYDSYMKDPATPEAVKRARKGAVLRLLEGRAADHYQTIPTNETVTWRFPLPASDPRCPPFSVRLRFTNQFEMRQDVRGVFALGDCRGVVSNITQAVIRVPLVPPSSGSHPPSRVSELAFANEGTSALMLRPRKDIGLLVPADAFWRNLLRAYVELVAILASVVAIGVFLSAGLGRPVALFVAFVMLIVSEMSPSVVEQYPDALETDVADRIGLYITRFAAEVTRPVSSAAPLGALAKDECVEPDEVFRAVLLNLLAFPLLVSLLSAFVLPRKQDWR